MCPRCHRNCLDKDPAMNPSSHVGNQVSICTPCGQAQGEVGMGYSTDIVEMEMEARFKKELGL